ncbi:MAG: hypothetical protein JKY93_00155 [Gammaproteobacteria bacterium]|nr:hypothetical protein [Gammaproteobacteria bacterium]
MNEDNPVRAIEDLIRVLSSGDYLSMREAAQFIEFYAYFDKAVLDALNKQITERYLDENSEKIELDSVAWLCRALARSTAPEYKDTIVMVKDKATNKRLRKYAKRYLKFYKPKKIKKKKKKKKKRVRRVL